MKKTIEQQLLENLSLNLNNLFEGWSQKYKKSINCSHPKGFSQKAHCAGKSKHNESVETELVCEDCGMCQTHGDLNEIAKGAKDSNGYTKCWPGKHAAGTKKGKNGGQVRNCVPNESINEDWNKVNHHDKTNGLSQKAVNSYRREHPGSKLKTAVTTKPSKLKAGSKAAKRRKSFCARMGGNKGPMKKPNGKPTPKALALRRWNCESIEEMAALIEHAELEIMQERRILEGIVGPVVAALRMFNRKKEAYELFTKKFPSVQEAETWASKYNAELHNIAPVKPPVATPIDLDPMVDQIKLAQKINKENFSDGKHPEDKGDSKRLGVPTKASVSTLRKVAHQGGRKGELAHWMANMKAGKKKHAGK
jgi:hypothetical protein